VRRLLFILAVPLAVALAVPVVAGSGSAPKWVEVSDGAYLAAWVHQGTIVYVPAETRLRPPSEGAAESTVPEAFEVEGGFPVPDMQGLPSPPETAEDGRKGFVHHVTGGLTTSLPTMNPIKLPGGWLMTLGGTDRYLRSTLDRLDAQAVAPSGQMYCTAGSLGRLEVRGLHGEFLELPGVPPDVLDSISGLAWSSDSTAVYLAHATGNGVEIWLAPLEGQARMLEVVPHFDGFAGTTPTGVLVYQYGLALDEITPTGMRTVLNLAAEDVPWAVSPNARYVLWLDRIVSLTSLDTGKLLSLEMPDGYELCPPFGWPGPTSSQIAVYACGRDPSDTLLLLYTETSPEHFELTAMTAPPSKDVCFDYNVDPVVVWPGVVSVVVTDRSAFCIGSAVNTGTWLVHFNGAGGR